MVTNGGYSLISEAVFLHKPICAISIPAQSEQWLNAAEVQQMGYGRHFEVITADNLRVFLYALGNFGTALAGYQQEGNAVLFAELDTLLKDIKTAYLPGEAAPPEDSWGDE